MTTNPGPAPITLPNSEQFYLSNEQGESYLIQISWPLHWQDHNPPSGHDQLPIIYIVDGNALFLTATEAAWRRAVWPNFAGGGIVVAIGYPLSGKVYNIPRRCLDLTPPTATRVDGYGGADSFLDFIDKTVKPAVRARFPRLEVSREALYGHSFGGLFALHALFTSPQMFDCYVASSPSIWWNGRCILAEARAFLDGEEVGGRVPALLMYFGSHEVSPLRWNDEELDHYERRKMDALEWRMGRNALELGELLRDCRRLDTVSVSEYRGEDHGSMMACSMSRALTTFFEEWPLRK
ncbi:hypothetical protein ETB97_002896 [Aspergillus alliaceus]|uniref:Siderophore esterase n=1 Tax=Petromyces alliaceus TaxID=209559 RepID=A0A8H6A1T6_PETAA|nr:hypothetical protein ETB97_002896 [Aspergillus burnettii]